MNGTSVASDDISSVIAFGPGKIGVMWSNQSQDAMYFAVHVDGAIDSTWQASKQAIAGPGEADDHINLKSLQSDGTGRVYAAVKTSLTTSNSPSLRLMVRDPATGNWTKLPLRPGVSDNFTRPVVMLDTSTGCCTCSPRRRDERHDLREVHPALEHRRSSTGPRHACS